MVQLVRRHYPSWSARVDDWSATTCVQPRKECEIFHETPFWHKNTYIHANVFAKMRIFSFCNDFINFHSKFTLIWSHLIFKTMTCSWNTPNYSDNQFCMGIIISTEQCRRIIISCQSWNKKLFLKFYLLLSYFTEWNYLNTIIRCVKKFLVTFKVMKDIFFHGFDQNILSLQEL